MKIIKVLVSGKLPKTCDCSLRGLLICMAAQRDLDFENLTISRPSWCPLHIEHGDDQAAESAGSLPEEAK